MITDELIQVVKDNPKICRYFDMPIQHISDRVLKRMGRKGDSKQIRAVIGKIKTAMPDAILRTSLIVGFPGESEEDFAELKNFVEETKFNRLGVFPYSMEDGTPAVKLDGHMDEEIKIERHNQIMEVQQVISEAFNNSLLGNELTCIVDELTEDGEYYVCRSYMDVPDIDGLVFVENTKEHSIGEFINVRVEGITEYDLIAKEI
jgi:ribosomal protein S12 methylthiotransferase